MWENSKFISSALSAAGSIATSSYLATVSADALLKGGEQHSAKSPAFSDVFNLAVTLKRRAQVTASQPARPRRTRRHLC